MTVRIDQNRLALLMGHASKQMVYEVYGKKIEDLERADRKFRNVSVAILFIRAGGK